MENSAVEAEDLVGPYTESSGTTATDLDRFGLREEASQILRRPTPVEESLLHRPLINFGRSGFEGYPRAGKKIATGFAPRGEDQFMI
jgi:hypothetical protein